VNGRGYGHLYKVNLTGDLNIPAGFYYNSQQGLNIAAGKKITLNGSPGWCAALYIYGATLGGAGEVVLAGSSNRNALGGNGVTIGSGVTVRGQSGSIGGGLINNGTIISDVAGGTLTINDVTNNGNIIAAPGQVQDLPLHRWQQRRVDRSASVERARAPTWASSTSSTPSTHRRWPGTINTVLLGTYAPASGTNHTGRDVHQGAHRHVRHQEPRRRQQPRLRPDAEHDEPRGQVQGPLGRLRQPVAGRPSRSPARARPIRSRRRRSWACFTRRWQARRASSSTAA
jgi:hypothetical protein